MQQVVAPFMFLEFTRKFTLSLGSGVPYVY